MQTLYFKNILLGISLIIIVIITLFYTIQQDSVIFKIENNVEFTDDEGFSCEENDHEAVLPLDQSVYFPSNSIFFIETSCKQLTSRQACSVESAARANPDRQINVLINAPISWNAIKNKSMSKLMAISNIEFARIKLKDYVKGTPLFTHIKNVANPTMASPDLMKFLTINKYSGIYLSSDVVVTRSFNNLSENWVVKDSPNSITSDMFSFSNNENGRILSEIAMNILINDMKSQEIVNFKGNVESHATMKNLIRIWCGKMNLLYVTSETCEDLQVLEPEKFFPISFLDKKKYYHSGGFDELKLKNTYTYQIWDYFTRMKTIPNDALYRKIAEEYCPIIYNFYGNNFGL